MNYKSKGLLIKSDLSRLLKCYKIYAAIIHEAAIGRINDEQLLKLRTLGLTEEEAEAVIIQNFLN